METTILACEMITKELTAVLEETNCPYPVVWLDAGLHNVPKKLHRSLQEALDQIQTERVLLTFGLCGESLVDIQAGNHELIIPKTDDCITMLIGSHEKRVQMNAELAAFYLTEGWVDQNQTPMQEYMHSVEKYGQEMAEDIMEMMYGNYRTLCILDTGLTDPEQLKRRCDPIAKISCTEICIRPGTLDWLRELISGPWDDPERFIVKKPGDEIITGDDWRWME